MNWSKGAAISAVIALGFVAQTAQAGDIGAVLSKEFTGWTTHQTVEGDLNGDDKPDVAAILSKPAEEEDRGQALLVVLLDDGKDSYKVLTQAPKAICFGCGGPKAVSDAPLGELSIAKGILHITYEGGSREEYNDEVKWRLDKSGKDFVLIGETRSIVDTLGEEPEDNIDVNYLSLKAEKSQGNKKKHTCAVAPEFKAVMLSSFDYEEKHIDDMEKIAAACDKH